MDRVHELGDASVPFAFDVHAMILSEDAPALECTLHQKFEDLRMNKVNSRKEFFKVGLTQIKEIVEASGVKTHWTLTSETHEYRESVAIEKASIKAA